MSETISTHALTEGDLITCLLPAGTTISTHALTEGDGAVADSAAVPNISTHALTEGDRPSGCSFRMQEYFNSRPHGGRHLGVHIIEPVF